MGTDVEPPERWHQSTAVAAGPSAAADARWFLQDALLARSERVDVETALLLTSEITTNAARHGREPIEVQLTAHDDRLRVAVTDAGEGFRPGESGTPQGFGLRLVDQLSDDWGVTSDPSRTEVWFEVARGITD